MDLPLGKGRVLEGLAGPAPPLEGGLGAALRGGLDWREAHEPFSHGAGLLIPQAGLPPLVEPPPTVDGTVTA